METNLFFGLNDLQEKEQTRVSSSSQLNTKRKRSYFFRETNAFLINFIIWKEKIIAFKIHFLIVSWTYFQKLLGKIKDFLLITSLLWKQKTTSELWREINFEITLSYDICNFIENNKKQNIFVGLKKHFTFIIFQMYCNRRKNFF